MPVSHQNIILKNKNLYCAKGSSSILEVINMEGGSILSCLLVHVYSCKKCVNSLKTKLFDQTRHYDRQP